MVERTIEIAECGAVPTGLRVADDDEILDGDNSPVSLARVWVFTRPTVSKGIVQCQNTPRYTNVMFCSSMHAI
jgi:hypothetical protein